jgi:uncharacterized RDD family membrane protein YckC
MTETETTPTVGIRLAAMLVDHFAMTFLSGIGAMLLIAPFALVLDFGKDIDMYALRFGGSLLLMGLVFSIYYNKDIVQGRSVAKRILRLQLVDNKSRKAATPIQCVLRSLTLPLWPLEVLVTLFSPTRRIGDLIAGTRVTVFDPERVDIPAKKAQYVVAILTGLVIVTLTMGLVQILLGKPFP